MFNGSAASDDHTADDAFPPHPVHAPVGQRSDTSTKIVAALVLIILAGALWGTFASGRQNSTPDRVARTAGQDITAPEQN